MSKRSGTQSTLGYALLGLLARGERTGYEIAQLMREPIGFFWHAGHSQIYPALARLEKAGLARHTLVRQAERPDKKRYRITAAGRAALREWIASPSDESTSRDEFTLRVFSMWLAPRVGTRRMLVTELARHEAMLSRHETIEAEARKRLPKGRRANDKQFANYATLRRGISYERHVIDWLRWVLAEIDRDQRRRV